MLHQHDGKVVVLAPYARDAQSVVDVLAGQGIVAEAVTSLADLVARLDETLGAVLMTEEALAQSDWSQLIDAAMAQPSWSAYPFILLIGQKRAFAQTEAVYSVLPAEITNVMVLERPMGSATLLSAVRWALAGRRRQYVTRDHLDQLERNSEQQRLMTRELAHRVKNTIAVLQSIVTQTMRPFPEMDEVKSLIVERFSALSRAHDLLLGTDFKAADFRDLVDRQLSVHQGHFRVQGPSIRLSPQASLSFALVLHELATNSIKYGSLKIPGGTVDISWSIGGGAPSTFAFRWRERGGPETSEPTQAGFGTRLIKSTLAGLGTVDFLYPREGFELAFAGELRELTHSVVPAFDG